MPLFWASLQERCGLLGLYRTRHGERCTFAWACLAAALLTWRPLPVPLALAPPHCDCLGGRALGICRGLDWLGGIAAAGRLFSTHAITHGGSGGRTTIWDRGCGIGVAWRRFLAGGGQASTNTRRRIHDCSLGRWTANNYRLPAVSAVTALLPAAAETRRRLITELSYYRCACRRQATH